MRIHESGHSSLVAQGVIIFSRNYNFFKESSFFKGVTIFSQSYNFFKELYFFYQKLKTFRAFGGLLQQENVAGSGSTQMGGPYVAACVDALLLLLLVLLRMETAF